MQAKMAAEGDCVVVHLSGRLDVESAVPFRRACLETLISKKVVFNFRYLSFVGSTGILPFLETMQDFMQVNPNGMRFCNVGSEFKKVLGATALNAIGIFESEAQAVTSFAQVQINAVANGTVPAPKHTPKAITEGINPIFLSGPDVIEAENENDPSVDESPSQAEEI